MTLLPLANSYTVSYILKNGQTDLFFKDIIISTKEQHSGRKTVNTILKEPFGDISIFAFNVF